MSLDGEITYSKTQIIALGITEHQIIYVSTDCLVKKI